MSRGQTSVHFFEAKWRILCLYPSNIFYKLPHFERPLRKAFKRQNIFSMFKIFSPVHLNNLLKMKPNVRR